MDPATIAALINAGVSIGGPILSKIFGGGGGRETSLTPEQEQFQNMLLTGILGGGGPFGQIGQFSLDDFQRNFGDPIRQQFQQRTVPAIQQRFAGLGQLRGTSAGDTIARSGADLEGQIAQLGFQGQQNALDRILRGAQIGLSTGSQQQDPGAASTFFAGLGQGAAQNFNLEDLIRGGQQFFGSGQQQQQGQRGNALAGARGVVRG